MDCPSFFYDKQAHNERAEKLQTRTKDSFFKPFFRSTSGTYFEIGARRVEVLESGFFVRDCPLTPQISPSLFSVICFVWLSNAQILFSLFNLGRKKISREKISRVFEEEKKMGGTKNAGK